MKINASTFPGGEAYQFNSYSLVLAAQVVWVPRDPDRNILHPRCWRQSGNTRPDPVDVNYKRSEWSRMRNLTKLM